jgi:alpha-tubulin suppressor-like RCC1 family protein
VVQAASGVVHTCARLADGSVVCFGWNALDQVGVDHTALLRSAMPQVVMASGAIDIAAGNYFTCAIVGTARTVVCWGSNAFGQLGTGTPAPGTNPISPAPLPIAGFTHARRLALGGAFACAVDDDGHVWCWGANHWGQTGQAPSNNVPDAAMVPMAAGTLLDHVVGIAAVINEAVCAWRDDGSVWCWGSNVVGQLGQGHPTVAPNATPLRVSIDADVDDVRGGYATFCAHHATTGRTTCWGDNSTGELGLGYAGPEVGPSTVLTPDIDHVQPAAGNGYACALRSDRTGVCWGANVAGFLGDGTSIAHFDPRPIVGLDRIVNLSGHAAGMCALRDDASLWCWGDDVAGQTGDPNALSALVPMPVLGLEDTSALSAGWGFACGLIRNGSVACAGNDDAGQLGDRRNTGSLVARTVAGVSNAGQLSSGISHSCVVLGDASHSVACWGAAESGQLGVDGHIGSRSFAASAGIDHATQVAAGGRHTCALRDDHTVWCWGANDRLQLGLPPTAPALTTCPRYGIDGSPTDDSLPCAITPQPVPGITNATAIVAGGLHTCALLGDGSVRCWGANTRGQLGDGTSTDRSVITDPGVASAVQVTASRRTTCRFDRPYAVDCEPSGDDHTCAVLADRSVRCWGRNDRGQIGDGTTMDRPSPTVASTSPGDVVDVRAGGAQTCFRHADGSVTCVGDAAEGQLGVANTAVFMPRPRDVAGP